MPSRLIWISIILWGSVVFVTRVFTMEEDEEDSDIVYHFGRNSTYQERRWNITRGSDLINDNYTENCLLEVSSKKSKWSSRGPLCEICSQVILIKFPPKESIKLRYTAFIHGILTFPPSAEEMLIDVVLCSYDPRIGLDRLYLTKGKNEHSAYVLNNVGVQASTEVDDIRNKKYKFSIEEYIVYDNKTTKEQ